MTNNKYIPVIDILVYLVIFFFSNIAVTTISFALFSGSSSPEESTEMAKLMFVPAFTLSIILIHTYRKVISKYRGVRFYIPKIGWYRPIETFFSLFFIIALSVVTYPIQELMPEQVEAYLNLFSSDDMWLNVAVTVIAAPLFEEYLFRGIIMRDMAYRWNPRIAIILSSLIFSLMHFNIVQLVPSLVAGLYLGYVYYKTNYSLITVMVIHSLNNLISITAIYTGMAEKNIVTLISDNITINYLTYIVSGFIVLRFLYLVAIVKERK